MTYGRSLGKALDHYHLDRGRWHELASNRTAWRAMLQAGVSPAEFSPRPPSPPPPPPPPLARTKLPRACAARRQAAIDGMRAKDAALQQILKPINR